MGLSRPVLTARFDEAMALARQLHNRQLRKGSDIPYFAHLASVASIVLKHGGNEDEAIAALLHDSVEDQGGAPTLKIIREKFGDRVADIVAACSDTDVVPKPPWRARKQAYIDHIAHASASARLVSAADKLDKARDILNDYQRLGEALWDRFSAPNGKHDALWYYRELVKAFQSAGNSPLVEELDQVVTQLEQYSAAQDEGLA